VELNLRIEEPPVRGSQPILPFSRFSKFGVEQLASAAGSELDHARKLGSPDYRPRQFRNEKGPVGSLQRGLF
jgi:hypothetical protein